MKPCAKINLGLNVTERRPDGYHNLETVFYPVPIFDELTVEEGGSDGCTLKVLGVDELCPPEKNLVVKAYNLLKAEGFALPPVIATLNKMLPSQAGMGGGSSDAAFMLRMLNEQFALGITVDQLQRYAAKLGADCAFFITADADAPQPVYATGIGDILQPIEGQWTALSGKWMALVKPDVAVSTKEAYAGITPHAPRKNCREVLMQPIESWKDDLVNDFEDSIFPVLPVLAEVKQSLYDNGAVYAAMSGSGSTVFGIFNDEPKFIKNNYACIYNTYFQIP